MDQTIGNVQKAIENSTFAVVEEGQRAASRVYDEAPEGINRFLQLIGSIEPESQMRHQLNEMVHTWRENRRKMYEIMDHHEQDVRDLITKQKQTVSPIESSCLILFA